MGARIVTFLACLTISGSGLFASVPVDPRAAKPWDYLVQELKNKGVETDVASVVQAALTHPDFNVRWMAADLLGQRGDHGAEEALRRILATDEERLVREAAAVALARLGHREFLEDVKHFMLAEESWSQRLKLAADLAGLGDFSGYELVVEAARSEDMGLRYDSVGIVRIFLIAGFSNGETRAPQKLLLDLLRDSSSKVRERALRHVSIAVAQGVPSAPFIETVTWMAEEDPDAEVREKARRDLVSWKRQLRDRRNNSDKMDRR